MHDYLCSVSLDLLFIFVVIMAALWNRADHYIFILFFLLLFSLPNLSDQRLDLIQSNPHGPAFTLVK